MRRIISLWVALLIIAAVQAGRSNYVSAAADAASVEELKLARLFVHVSSRGFRFYKLRSDLPPGLSDGPWKLEGAACIVATDAAPGLKPIYLLTKADNHGVRFNYAGSKRLADEAGSGTYQSDYWKDQGVAFYVAATQLPGTVPLYKLHKHPGIIATGPQAGQLAPGTDAVFLTTDPALREKMMAQNWKNGRILGYVWLKAPEAGPLPDLFVQKVEADEFAVKAVIGNQGKLNTGGAKPAAHIQLLDKANNIVYSYGKLINGMSPGQWQSVAFETGGRSLVGLRYRVMVDAANAIKESNEGNNETQLAEFHRKIKLNPLPSDHVQPASIQLASVESSPAQSLPKRTLYRLTITNPQAYKAELFQPTQKLPPNPCGPGQTDARLLARFHVVRGGKAINAGCKPLKTAADMKTLQIDSSVPLADTDQLRITLEDRESGQKYQSQPYAVGWFGIDKTLVPAGCKYFLGRAGSYLCTSDTGMAACESQKQKGKPIQCTRAGKQTK